MVKHHKSFVLDSSSDGSSESETQNDSQKLVDKIKEEIQAEDAEKRLAKLLILIEQLQRDKKGISKSLIVSDSWS